jgi:PKHD-type hydroxylase
MIPTLSNLPMQKQLFTKSWVVDNDAFRSEEVDEIVNITKTLQISKGELFKSNPDYSTREALTGWIESPTAQTQWIYDRLNYRIENYNNHVFNLDLSGIPYIQYAEYHEGGHHDFHMDLAFDGPRVYDYTINEFFRKLTVVVLLTEPNLDFNGGEFQINMSMERTPVNIPMRKGSVLMFPSYLLHRVCPVSRGLRKTLTTWVLGPKLR